jgi:hypothetical protein
MLFIQFSQDKINSNALSGYQLLLESAQINNGVDFIQVLQQDLKAVSAEFRNSGAKTGDGRINKKRSIEEISGNRNSVPSSID